MKTLLLIEDDGVLVAGLREAFEEEHFRVLSSPTGMRGYEMAKHEQVDIIILDLKLPDIPGEEVCAKLRKEGVATPILMLTSKKHEADKVIGLELGGDDYVTKPFSTRELFARVHALLRRPPVIAHEPDEYSFGDVYVDFKKKQVTKKGRPLMFTAREFDVLRFLIMHEGEVVTREMLLNQVWGYEVFPTTRTVDNHILALRKQLENDSRNPRHIITVHTEGYRFVKGE